MEWAPTAADARCADGVPFICLPDSTTFRPTKRFVAIGQWVWSQRSGNGEEDEEEKCLQSLGKLLSVHERARGRGQSSPSIAEFLLTREPLRMSHPKHSTLAQARYPAGLQS